VGLCYRLRPISAILATTLGSGAAGLSALKPCGGISVVQDASDAFPEMPTTALTRLEPEHVIGIAGMPRVEMLTKFIANRAQSNSPWRALMAASGQERRSRPPKPPAPSK